MALNAWNKILSFLRNFKITSDGSIRGDERPTPLPGRGGKLVTDLLGTSSSDGSSGLYGALTNWLNAMSGAHLTNAQVEANEMQMQNAEDIYQRQVTGMQKAGLNPALMYQSGATSAPQVQASAPAASMSDLMNLFLVKKQSALLDAQANQLNTQADKNAADTENMRLINKYYPTVTETQIRKVLSDIGVNDELIQKYMSEVDLNEMESSLKQIQTVIERAKADESSAYYKALREYQEESRDKVKQEKAELVVRTAMETIERDFMKATNTKMGSATLVAVASALGTLLSNFHLDIDSDSLKKALGDKWNAFKEWFKNNYQHGESGSNIFGIDPE